MTSEKMMEMSEKATDALREEAVYQAQTALQGDGSDECVDCDAEIPTARRRAIPSVTRCIACQTNFERNL